MRLQIEPYGECTLNEGNSYLIFFPETPAEKDLLIRLGLGKTSRTALLPVNLERMGRYFRKMKMQDVLREVSGEAFDFFKEHLHDKVEDLPRLHQRCALLIVLQQTSDIVVTNFYGMDPQSVDTYLRFIKSYNEHLRDKIIIAVASPYLGWDFKDLRVVNLATTHLDLSMEQLYGPGSRRYEVEFKFKAPEPQSVKRLKRAVRYFRYLLIVLLIIFIVKILPWILLALFGGSMR